MKARVLGPAFSAAPVEELRSLGVSIAAGGATGPILVTSRALPRRLPEPPWLWLPPTTPPLDEATRALLAGADAVLPLDEPTALAAVAAQLRSIAARAQLPALEGAFPATSEAARRVLGAIERAAQTSMAVLLTGETGTGKDVAAHQLHAWSPRASHRFVPINCAALPNELIEGELFGYVRGAFSGAVADYDGQFQAAAGGTVFLDEVDDTPKTLQVKLLRVLEDHVVSRLGENKWRPVDFRVVAATNRDLRALVQRGEFGDDLYQRLAIVQIQLPPLRDRKGDIPGLAAHFLERFHHDEPTQPRVARITPLALAALLRYPWPGNIRELRNTIFQSLINKRAGEELLLSDLPEPILHNKPSDAPSILDPAAIDRALATTTFDLRATLDTLERTALTLALARCNNSPTAAARLLGTIGRGSSSDPGGTVRAMMRRHGLKG
jgi:transcriptional regulator with PAS, ATPase and Fis domain